MKNTCLMSLFNYLPSVGAAGVCVFFLSACSVAGSEREKDLMRRAVFDLQCPRTDISKEVLYDSHQMAAFGVVGCKKRAVYTVEYYGPWKLDTPILIDEPVKDEPQVNSNVQADSASQAVSGESGAEADSTGLPPESP